MLSHGQLQVLHDVRQFLHIPHAVQVLLSAEKTPTLSLALPMHEELLELFKGLESALPNISHSIRAAREKIEKYLKLSRKTPIYSLAMSLDVFPLVFVCSLTSIHSHKSYNEIQLAREALGRGGTCKCSLFYEEIGQCSNSREVSCQS